MKRMIMQCFIPIIAAVAALSAEVSAPQGLLLRGAASYDSTLLKEAIRIENGNGGEKSRLFLATCTWRLQLIAFATDDKKGVVRYGLQALALLDSAEIEGEDAFSVNVIRAYVNQLISGTGVKNGAVYGPRTAENLAIVKKLRPLSFEARYIESVNLLEMPAFVGGNPGRAARQLEALVRDYPDSSHAAVMFARALARTGKKEEAAELIDKVLKADPANLLAMKALKEIGR